MASLIKEMGLALSKKMTGSILTKNGVIFPTDGHFVQGILFENTPYKDAFYVWKLIIPLFSKTANFGLNYSERINLWPGAFGPYFCPSEKKSQFLENVIISISEKYSDVLSQNINESEFIALCKPDSPRLNLVLDYAITLCILGDIKEACDVFLKITESDMETIPGIKEFARELLISLNSGGEAWKQKITLIENQNYENFFGIKR